MSECLDFWDHHLKDKPSPKQLESKRLLWFQCEGNVPPAPCVDAWDGEWIATDDLKTCTDQVTFKVGEDGVLRRGDDECCR